MNRLIVATTNPGKIHEVKSALGQLTGWSVEGLPPGVEDVEETGATFMENAILKALHYSRRVNAMTLADDSGLSVAALDDRPGIHSARYAPTPEGRIQRLLSELAVVGGQNRAARFFCALAIAQAGAVLWATEKYLDGRIAEQPAGVGGFGYDPVFLVPAAGITLAELTIDEKNRISARGLALAELRRFLESA